MRYPQKTANFGCLLLNLYLYEKQSIHLTEEPYFLYGSYGNRRKAKSYRLYRWIQLLLWTEIDHTMAEILLA